MKSSTHGGEAMLLVWWGLGSKTADTCPGKLNLVKLLMVAALACTMPLMLSTFLEFCDGK